ncbi:hypothetical protein [Streptomyces sp. HC307]|uniref:hypothetical protein n=1 Tax=Streptomyces flavusporus TaxID=3385496 RepID=UPI003916DA7A
MHPVDGDQHRVRIIAWAGGHRHKPHPGLENADGADEWRALMQQCIDALHAAE